MKRVGSTRLAVARQGAADDERVYAHIKVTTMGSAVTIGAWSIPNKLHSIRLGGKCVNIYCNRKEYRRLSDRAQGLSQAATQDGLTLVDLPGITRVAESDQTGWRWQTSARGANHEYVSHKYR